ncbi:MAG: M20/M25/M40 family metallo-hydrolase [Planctomycetes bacterium]|nr:M20/M25/M40 family metallo-hydrolase [Planctomycetota bacterium]
MTFDRAAALDRHLRAILENPTAPFREAAVLAAIDVFAKERSGAVELRVDSAGNRILEVRGSRAGDRAPSIAFTAHVDHPALVRAESGDWELLGRVWPAARLVGGTMRFFRSDGEPAGRGRVERVRESEGRVTAEVARDGGGDRAGDFAMFDFPALRREDDLLHGRVCDDLLGGIAILGAIDECLATQPECCFLAAFTRAEEVGFVGALAMLQEGSVPREVPIVGLECSAARGGNAVVGSGPIVRVGDRSATFDPGVTAFLRDCAEEIGKEDKEFRYQRRLMQGGSCESTAYLLDGRRAGAMCLALGNYHNVPDPDPEDPSTGLAAENVSYRDLDGLVRLIARSVARCDALADPWKPIRDALAKRLESLRGRLSS